ncbi:unnamed protein product [Zygosaccharomyces bailii CLIB 213]|uniref:Phosphotransferase n=1 Tax=Zygosaccharomyces bailii (strain CLIB 213 / ATCC 58445 / CBS 680 / BCRC 21525 / NBRC 1098 / NCYC 1416 / NRRL Y-2227) TaxID=1333698 RepID=A0A8J2TAL6_ZYGB2|nr:unnamed protein product [Zygosaccharomyces bailii CLIB 213]
MARNTSFLEHLREQLIPHQPLKDVSKKFLAELKRNLQKSERSMLASGLVPSWQSITGANKPGARILAIDFGGSTLKFALVYMPKCEILFQDRFDIVTKVVDQKFFDVLLSWISLKLNEYFASNGTRVTKLPVSVTFSFPLNERDEIITMGKGFDMAPEIQGRSVKDLIRSSFDRILQTLPSPHFGVEMCDVINDAVAVYLASKFMYKNQSISLILGTGVNSCFELPLELMPLTNKPMKNAPNCNCLVNVEAGFLGAKFINITPFDDHDDGERFMPLEDITSGKWLPMALANIAKEYDIKGLDSRNIDGELFVAIADGRYSGTLDSDNLELACEISRMLIRRAAFYVVAMLLAVGSLVNGGSDTVIEVGYVGSFLANCLYYQEQISIFAGNDIRFQFLHDSNLLGAAVATYLNKFTEQE